MNNIYDIIAVRYSQHCITISQGNIVPHKQTFPSGIKALADYVHARGLKLGVYSDAGYAICKHTNLLSYYSN
jgi:hypothetical protein